MYNLLPILRIIFFAVTAGNERLLFSVIYVHCIQRTLCVLLLLSLWFTVGIQEYVFVYIYNTLTGSYYVLRWPILLFLSWQARSALFVYYSTKPVRGVEELMRFYK